MDPVSHAAFSRTLIGLAPGGVVRGAVVAAALGALAPDLDAILMPLGWDLYLRVHEVGTHTIVGTTGCALLTAAVVRAFVRGGRFAGLILAAWTGATSHILLDLLSSARLRVGWPLFDTVVSVPLVAMAEPWLFMLCLAGPAAIWSARRRQQKAAISVLAVIAVFLLAKAVLGVLAFSSYRAAREGAAAAVHARVIEAKWASLDTWHVFDRTADRVRHWRASARRGAAELVVSWPLESETASLEASRSLSTVRNFLRVHQLGFAVTLARPGDRHWVLWSDIRYCWDPGQPGAPQLEPTSQSPTSAARIACAVWFGVEFDVDGRPIQQIVKIGGFTQTRALGR